MKTIAIEMLKSAWLYLALFVSASAWAAPVAHVTHLSGVLTSKSTAGVTKILSVKSEVNAGDVLTTAQETYARIKFLDQAEIVMRPGSQLAVEDYAFDEGKPDSDSAALKLTKGGLRAVTGLLGKRNRDAVRISTPTATIGIRGTHFGALFCQNDCDSVPTASGLPPADGLHLDVTDGAIAATNLAGTQVIGAGQFGYVRDTNTPPILVPPQQGIQVTMPSSISQNNSTGRGVGKSNDNQCVAQ